MIIRLKTMPDGQYRSIEKQSGITIETVVKEFKTELRYRPLLARVNGEDMELNTTIENDCTIELLDMRDRSANRVYQRSLSLIYLKAVKDVIGDVPVELDNSLNKGLYTMITADPPITEAQVEAIEKRMRELVDMDLPIVCEYYNHDEGVRIWERYNYPEKSKLLDNASYIKQPKFYRIEGYRNFFFGPMTPSTGYIEYFELRKYKKGVLLRFPYMTKPDEIPQFVDDEKLYYAFGEAKKWQNLLGVAYLEDLNEKIRRGDAKDLILLSEALHEKKIAEIADMITTGKKRIILIAGPSSSGKTTFARRLCVQLRVNGQQPLYMGTDDYFVERNQTPKGPDGEPNYEDLEAIDVELFNSNMNDLLRGEETDLPEFDFMNGTKIFGKRITSMTDNQPIVIEGIHALNDKLTELIPDNEKFRIYISPFTQLNIDVHNRVPTTDARMLRRMVRDYKYRGHSAADTIAQWPKVRVGEDKNIFPYNGKADVLFNSALVYELSLLKKYAEPLLKEVGPEQPEHSEAVRMLDFIRFFDVLENEGNVPNNSIMREFIGGSIFMEQGEK